MGDSIPANHSLDFIVQRPIGLRPARWIEVSMASLKNGAT
jgi:hypothetical protein